MRNKNIIIVIVVVVVLAVAAIAFWTKKSNTKQTGSISANQTEQAMNDNQESNASNQQGQVAGESTTKAAPSQTPSVDCKRDFNADTLKNATVDFKNKTVELNVRGFGVIDLQLYDREAPKTVENFVRLVNAGYYNCITFHRVSKGFVIQGGDPTGTGSGGESAFGGEFADETNPELQIYKTGYVKGTLAMANRGPNTNTSQFFIMLEDKELPPNYTIFGKVEQGMDVVSKIEAVDITPGMFGPTDGAPKTPVIMTSVKIIN
jgi:cyclophilin family peptidyl-prolyl cis-trans isomerase/Tfp pilus assembly protein PilE